MSDMAQSGAEIIGFSFVWIKLQKAVLNYCLMFINQIIKKMIIQKDDKKHQYSAESSGLKEDNIIKTKYVPEQNHEELHNWL